MGLEIGPRPQSLFFDQALLPSGWASGVRLELHLGRIARIEIDALPLRGEERHACALPGVANLHSHAFQRAMAGMAERRGPSADSFWTWREVMYRSLDRLTPELLRAIAALAYIEMLESGFTRVGEFYYAHHDPDGRPYSNPGEMSGAIAEAAAQSGIGLTLLPVLYSYSGFGKQSPHHAQRRFISDLDGYARLIEAADWVTRALPDAQVGLAPHSLRAVSPDQIAVLPQLGCDRRIHIHIAEQVKEVEDCLAWSGQRPVEWLLDTVKVDDRWCLVHATHMTERETRTLARTGATVGVCPVTEANLGDGLFPAKDYLAAGGSLGIGTDSNILIDLSEELRLFEYGQRLLHRERNILSGAPGRSTGRRIFEAAVDGGARALGTAPGLAVGAAADIVSLDVGHVSLTGKKGDALLDGFIFAAGKAAVDCVWRYGEKLVVKGRHRARAETAGAYVDVIAELSE